MFGFENILDSNLWLYWLFMSKNPTFNQLKRIKSSDVNLITSIL